jgi:hypothetical protein
MGMIWLKKTEEDIIKKALFDSITLKEEYIQAVREDFGESDTYCKEKTEKANQEIKKIRKLLKRIGVSNAYTI